jgi:hypothetical protein
MNWNDLLRVCSDTTNGPRSAGQSPIDFQAAYVPVPVELTMSRLNWTAEDFHEVQEEPFSLFAGGRRTALHPPYLAVLVAQYGMGKTSFVEQLCAFLVDAGRQAVLVNLADSRQAWGSDTWIEGLNESNLLAFLFGHIGRTTPDPKAFYEMLQTELLQDIYSGQVTLVLDSIDEMGLNRSHLLKFMEILVDLLVPTNSAQPFRPRVLISVRSEYLGAFGIDDAKSLIGAKLADLLTVYFLQLSPFSESRIQSYLERRRKREIATQLVGAPALRDILIRPLFLRIFCDLPDGLNTRDLKRLKSPTLLIQSFIEKASEVARQQIRGPFQWDEDGLARVAAKLYNTGALDIAIDTVRNELVSPRKIDVDQTWEAIHKCPFLRKSGEDRVRFSHRVFVEYFTAKELAAEGDRKDDRHYNAFDTLVLDVDTRKFLRDMFGENWYTRTKHSYGFNDQHGWSRLPEDPEKAAEVKKKLESIRRALLDYMTEPEAAEPVEVRRNVLRLLEMDDEYGLHPCYRMYNYEAVGVYLWYNRRDEEDQKISSYFEDVLKQRLDDASKHLTDDDPLRAHYGRLVERIVSVGERLRYEKVKRFDTRKIVKKIFEPDTLARIKHIVDVEA